MNTLFNRGTKLTSVQIMLSNTTSNLIKISADRLRNRVDLHQSLGGHFINFN